MELRKVKLKLSREELKKEHYKPTVVFCEECIDLPTDEVMLGILHRMIEEDKGKDNGSGQSSSVR